MKRPRNITKKLVLLLIGLAIGLVAAELCLRVLGVSHPLPYVPDPHCSTRLKPDFSGWWRKEGSAFIEINERGFRHGDRSLEKPDNRLRIAVLGDSFIEAFQVSENQTFCAVLEEQLTESRPLHGYTYDVLNFGVSGYGTAQELQMLRHYVWQYEPDIVLLAFFPGNDLRNNSSELEPYQVRPFFRQVGDQLELDKSFLQHPDYLKAQSRTVRWKVALINRCRLLQLLNHIRETWREPGPTEPDATAVRAGIDLASLAEPKDEAWSNAWQLTERLVLEIAADSERHQAEFYLLTIGSDVVVHPDGDVASECCQELGVQDLSYPQQRLMEFCSRNDLTVIDLARPMQQYARREKVFLHGFENGELGFGHWNTEGNRLAAEIVGAELHNRLMTGPGRED